MLAKARPNHNFHRVNIIESVDSIDEPDSPLTEYITNAGISHTRYTITHFRHHHRVLQLISNQMIVYIISLYSPSVRILTVRSKKCDRLCINHPSTAKCKFWYGHKYRFGILLLSSSSSSSFFSRPSAIVLYILTLVYM